MQHEESVFFLYLEIFCVYTIVIHTSIEIELKQKVLKWLFPRLMFNSALFNSLLFFSLDSKLCLFLTMRKYTYSRSRHVAIAVAATNLNWKFHFFVIDDRPKKTTSGKVNGEKLRARATGLHHTLVRCRYLMF